MKEKRLVAMFISSIVAFVASLSISIGVAVAFAEPVVATGLSELSYTVAATDTSAAYQQFTFSPATAFNDNVKDKVFVNGYDDVQLPAGTYLDAISLIKVAITNDSDDVMAFTVDTLLEASHTSADKLVENAYVKLFATTLVPSEVLDLNPDYTDSRIREASGSTKEMYLDAHTTGYYIMATFVSDPFAEIDWSEYLSNENGVASYMTMKVGLTIKYR